MTSVQGYDCACGGVPLSGLVFDEPFAIAFNASTETPAWRRYFAGEYSEEQVPLAGIYAGQPDLCGTKLARVLEDRTLIDRGRDPIVVLEAGDRRMVMDGHHRVTVAIHDGREFVPARVVRIDNWTFAISPGGES